MDIRVGFIAEISDLIYVHNNGNGILHFNEGRKVVSVAGQLMI